MNQIALATSHEAGFYYATGLTGVDTPSFESDDCALETKTQHSRPAKAATGSIGHLPAEILMQIFSHVHPTSPVGAGSVMLVCRYWHAVALRTYAFWRDLVASTWALNSLSIRAYPERLAALEFAVAHSGTFSLNLDFIGMGEPLAAFLAGHRPRISSITLSVVVPRAQELECLHTVVGAEMPKLETLVVKQHRGPEHRIRAQRLPYPKLVEYLQPRLHTLQLPGYHFTIEAPLPSVRHLTLTSCLWEGCGCDTVLFDSLMDVLGQVPNLETLTLNECIPAHGIPTRRARLAALQTLTVHDYLNWTTDLLCQMDIPENTVLDVNTPCDDEEVFMRGIPSAPWPTLPAVCGAESLHVCVRGSKLTTMVLQTRTGGAPRMRVASSVRRHPLQEMLLYVRAMLTLTASLKTLVLDICVERPFKRDGLQQIWSTLSGQCSTVGMLGMDCRKALLPFMSSEQVKHAFRTVKHLYFTWDTRHDEDSRLDYSASRRFQRAQSPDADLTSSAAMVQTPPRITGVLPYDPEACEAFCDAVEPVLIKTPYADTLETLHVLLVRPYSPRDNATVVNTGSVQERLSGRLGYLVRVSVSWYDSEGDSESAMCT